LEPVAGGTSVAVILPVEPVEAVELVEAVEAGEAVETGETVEAVSTRLTDTSTGSEVAASDAAPTPLPALG
ncbi:MAG: hypothetical protein QOE15_2664, partial [Acidimicrobiaceae bacterium]|nr:hypothetical protein [Acidimicrobiaceae bacterium]